MGIENELPQNTEDAFTINNDGDLVMGDLSAEPTTDEGGDVDPVSAIFSGKPQVKESKTDPNRPVEKPAVSTPVVKTTVEAKPKENEQPSVDPAIDAIRQENENLKARLAALEQHTNEEIQTQTAEEQQAATEAFNKEIRDGVNEILGDVLNDDQKEKFVGLLEKFIDKKSADSTKRIENFLHANEMASTELRQVFQVYNGQDGKPAVYQMNKLVGVLVNSYGKELFQEYPLTTIFRAAENVPFMMWLNEKYPNEVSKMDFQQICVASEKVREAFYKGKTGSKYEHLTAYLDGAQNTNTPTPSNEDVTKLEREAENLAPNRGVGIAAEGSTLVNRPAAPITSARQAVERSLKELGLA